MNTKSDGLTLTFTLAGATPEQASKFFARLGRSFDDAADVKTDVKADQMKIARRLVGYISRHDTQKKIMAALLRNDGVLTYENLVAAHGGKAGPSLAGCLSSITKNWRKSGGAGKFFRTEQGDSNIWLYSIDRPFVSALRAATSSAS
jgi:hypothetical protein